MLSSRMYLQRFYKWNILNVFFFILCSQLSSCSSFCSLIQSLSQFWHPTSLSVFFAGHLLTHLSQLGCSMGQDHFEWTCRCSAASGLGNHVKWRLLADTKQKPLNLMVCIQFLPWTTLLWKSFHNWRPTNLSSVLNIRWGIFFVMQMKRRVQESFVNILIYFGTSIQPEKNVYSPKLPFAFF